MRGLLVHFVLAIFAIIMSGCTTSVLDVADRGDIPVPPKAKAEMKKRGLSPTSPVLVRIFKRESELELWKMNATGQYVLFKTYPMCRWSGKLGPKKADGDRQAPEGYYMVSASMLNPSSKYFLSFNLGYPNSLEKALGYTGNALMVHGACSSSGCFAITDKHVAEVYAIARDALRGGQTEFQVQSYPFRMTPENMALHSSNPNLAFWQNLKTGNDYFEVTRQAPDVSYCGGRYVFNADFGNVSPDGPLAACPARRDDQNQAVLAKSHSDREMFEAILTLPSNVSASSYSDGGMHPTFRSVLGKHGTKKLSELTSKDRVPVSKPDAALADPYRPD